tara:strand:- start:109 stop:243 length:135 start_codon:yes stop_codon:yes gene_type:complete
MKGVKRKNPESKVEGTFKIRGEFSRHNVGEVDPFDMAYVGPIKS